MTDENVRTVALAGNSQRTGGGRRMCVIDFAIKARRQFENIPKAKLPMYGAPGQEVYDAVIVLMEQLKPEEQIRVCRDVGIKAAQQLYSEAK